MVLYAAAYLKKQLSSDQSESNLLVTTQGQHFIDAVPSIIRITLDLVNGAAVRLGTPSRNFEPPLHVPNEDTLYCR